VQEAYKISKFRQLHEDFNPQFALTRVEQCKKLLGLAYKTQDISEARDKIEDALSLLHEIKQILSK